jgi:hypothetical protein
VSKRHATLVAAGASKSIDRCAHKQRRAKGGELLVRTVPNRAAAARQNRARRRFGTALRVARVRTLPLPLPVRLVKKGHSYKVVDGAGRNIGTIPFPENVPRLGRLEQTVYLWREN